MNFRPTGWHLTTLTWTQHITPVADVRMPGMQHFISWRHIKKNKTKGRRRDERQNCRGWNVCWQNLQGGGKNTTKTTTTTESKSSLPGISTPANDFKEFYEVAADGGQRRANSNVPLGVCGDTDFGLLCKTQLRFALQNKKRKKPHKSNISDFVVFALQHQPSKPKRQITLIIILIKLS